ncbi:MAG: hypothetical protein IJ660_00430 [Alphaproteobacteria bacterium]|nr:hypothetical protein [Alphaproteobacteria bacterium]
MKWVKKGFICSSETFNLSWYKKYTMTPLPYFAEDGSFRIYLTMCDENNYGRAGYITVNPENPAEIYDITKEPVLDLGERGTFDEHGILPCCLLKDNGRLYMYYSAYQHQVSTPYTIYSGIAVSENDGKTFKKMFNVPILDRINGELSQRSATEVMKKDGKYKMWYTANVGWINNGIHEVPKYDIKYLESDIPDKWDSKPVCAVPFKNDDEYGLTMPQVFYENGKYKMVYSIRSLEKGYIMGYAESKDGIHFERQDEKMEIQTSNDGFDSEMICYGKTYTHKGKVYLIYCGNRYGLAGIGYAVLENASHLG